MGIVFFVLCKCVRQTDKVDGEGKQVDEEVNVDWTRSDPFPNAYELQVRLNNEADPGYESSEGSELIQKYFPKNYDPNAYAEKYKLADAKVEVDSDVDSDLVDETAHTK